MANINPQSLADQLAKAAGGVATKQGAAPAKTPTGSGWTVPVLGDFNVDEAVSRAVSKAANYLNFMLEPEGLVIELQQGEVGKDALVRERGGERQYRTYANTDVLKLYANQHGGRGVVADGQV